MNPADEEQPGASAEDTVLEALWGDRVRPRRGPKPKLSVERIVAVGVELADTEGLTGLSVARVAKKLDTPLMSLYRYVRSKPELVALMLDTVIGPAPDLIGIEGGWRPRLRFWALANENVFRAHPWALPLATMRRAVGPNEVAWLEAGLGALDGVGLTDQQMLEVVLLVNNHARGNAQTAADAAAADPGEGGDGSVSTYAAIFERPENRDRYPVAARVFGGGAFGRGEQHFGLECVLDGIQEFIAEKR